MTKLQDRNYFLFTQQSLSTFENCPLKFKKRYIENLKWNNVGDETKRKSIERGKDFHLLAQRYFLGVDLGLQSDREEHAELKHWVDSLKKDFPINKGIRYLPEYKLRMNSSLLKLEANFDLLLIKEDKIEIWDWKTHNSSQKQTKLLEKSLIESFQSIVYLFILKEEIRLITGKELQTNKISMYYWQPNPAETVAEIIYSEEMHEKSRRILESKIKSIYEYDYYMFNKEQFRKHCKICEFNWLCNKEEVDFSFQEEDYFEENQ